MSQELAREKERLLQAQRIAAFSANLPLHDLLTAYLKDDKDERRRSMSCALIPNARVEKSLSRPEWDLMIGSGGPGVIQFGAGEGSRTEYFRHGNDDGIEPLILWRTFDGLWDPYVEISEEFRLFHNLFHDKKTDRFYKLDDAGNEHLVATIESKCVKIRLLEIRQFCAVRELHLAIYMDSVERSQYSLSDVGLAEGGGNHIEALTVYGLHNGEVPDMRDAKAFSRLLAKRLVPPLPKEKSGVWGYGEPEPARFVDFVIDLDQDGNEVTSTSSEEELNNYFGRNPERPHYLTPVFFRKAVLDKYYQQSGKYTVGPGYLRCAGLWGMSLDNHLDDYVVGWLGDLGRDLPYQEQLHWRSFNVPPAGGMSQTFFRQQILSEWADTEHPEHLFKHEYSALANDTQKRLGWQILLPLTSEDQHYLRGVRPPPPSPCRGQKGLG